MVRSLFWHPRHVMLFRVAGGVDANPAALGAATLGAATLDAAAFEIFRSIRRGERDAAREGDWTFSDYLEEAETVVLRDLVFDTPGTAAAVDGAVEAKNIVFAVRAGEVHELCVGRLPGSEYCFATVEVSRRNKWLRPLFPRPPSEPAVAAVAAAVRGLFQ